MLDSNQSTLFRRPNGVDVYGTKRYQGSLPDLITQSNTLKRSKMWRSHLPSKRHIYRNNCKTTDSQQFGMDVASATNTSTTADDAAAVDDAVVCHKSPLHMAACEGYVEIVEFLLSEGVNVDSRDSNGETALHMATKHGRTDIVRLLVSKRADVSARNAAHETALDTCLNENLVQSTEKYEIVNILVRALASQNNNCCQYMPPELCNPTEVRRRVDHLPINGIVDVKDSYEKPNRSNTDVLSPLEEEQQQQQPPPPPTGSRRRYTLSELPIDVPHEEYRQRSYSINSRTPAHTYNHAHHSLQRGMNSMANRRLSASFVEGRVLNGSHRLSLTHDGLRAANGAIVKKEFGISLLHLAVLGGTVNVVKTLLKYDINMNATDSGGQHPLHLCALSGHADVMRLLIGQGVDPNIRNFQQQCALHLTAVLPRTTSSRILLRWKADVNAQDAQGLTPLHKAAEAGTEEMVKLFLNKGAYIDMCSDTKQQPLHVAASNGRTRIVELLLLRGADVNAADDNGCMAIHLAAESDSVDVVKVLILHNADVNGIDYKGRTSLHIASAAGNAEVVQTLINRGADVTIRDSYGFTADRLAMYFDQNDVLGVLVDHVTHLNKFVSQELREFNDANYLNGMLRDASMKVIAEEQSETDESRSTIALHRVESHIARKIKNRRRKDARCTIL